MQANLQGRKTDQWVAGDSSGAGRASRARQSSLGHFWGDGRVHAPECGGTSAGVCVYQDLPNGTLYICVLHCMSMIETR